MKLIHILLLLAVSFDVTAGAGTFPQGKNVKLLKDSLEFKTGITIGKDSVDPQSVATPADQGSLLISNDNLYLKMDDGMTTAWRPIDLPDQTNKEQHILTSDGTVASWGADLPPIIAQKYTNRNVIVNSDFEDEGTDWTITGGCVASYPETPELEKTLRLTCTAATFSVKQTSTLLVPFAGQQAAFDLQVKSDTNGVKVASINNSIRNTEYSVIGDDEFKRFKQIGVIADAVNNGLEIYSDVPFTGVVDIDNAYLGLSNLTQEVSGAHFVGSLTYQESSCQWSSVGTGYSGFPVDANCSASNIVGGVQAPSTKIPAISILNSRTDGTYQIQTTGLNWTDGTNSCYFSLSTSDNYENQGAHFAHQTESRGTNNLEGNFRFTTTGIKTVQIISSQNSGNCVTYGNTTESRKFTVHFFPDDKHTIVNQTQNNEDVTVIAKNDANQVLASGTTILAPTEIKDTTNSFASGVFTVPENEGGDYDAHLRYAATSASGHTIYAYVDGALYTPMIGKSDTLTTSSSAIIPLTEGQTVSFRGNASFTISNVKIEIAKRSSETVVTGNFSQIRNDDLALVEAYGNGNESLGAHSAIRFAKTHDPNNQFTSSTGIFVPKKSGHYSWSGMVYYNASNTASIYVKSGTRANKYAQVTYTSRAHKLFYVEFEATAGENVYLAGDIAGTLLNNPEVHHMTIRETPTKESIVANLMQGQTTSCQTKILSTNTSVGVTGVMSDLSFTLEVGKKYSIIGRLLGATGNGSSTNKQWQVTVRDGATSIDRPWVRLYPIGDALALLPVSKKFTATSTSLTFDVTAVTASEAISAGVLNSYMELCELPETTILQ